MGITIHYTGKLEDRARLAELLDAARLYCAEQRWHALEIEERVIGRVERLIDANGTRAQVDDTEIMIISRDAAITEWSPIDDTLRGFIITVHPESEPVWLTFNEAGEMVFYMPLNDPGEYWENRRLFTKTQFAGLETHAAVCEFLHWLKENYIPKLDVYDEANYFETGDAVRAAQAFDTLTAAINQLSDALENLDSDDPRAEFMREVLDSLAQEKADQEKPRPKKKLKVERGKKISRPDPQWKRGRGVSANKN